MPPRAETYRGESGGPNVEPPIVLSRGALGGVSTCWPPYVTTGKYLQVWPPREAQPRLWCPVFTGLQHILSAGLTVSFQPSWRSGLIPLEVGTDNCVPRGTHCKSCWCTVGGQIPQANKDYQAGCSTGLEVTSQELTYGCTLHSFVLTLSHLHYGRKTTGRVLR